MSEHEAIADIIAEMRRGMNPNGTAECQYLESDICMLADRLDAALKREADSIHRAMVILAGIEIPNPDYPPKLWTALEDAYDALSDALGTDGDTTADEEEAKSTGRHFVIRPSGDAAKLREALKHIKDRLPHMLQYMRVHWEDANAGGYFDELMLVIDAALAAPPRNCDRYATADEALKAQEQMFNDSNFANGECKLGCPECDNPRVGCKIAWLFALATEQEGGNDEQK